MKANIVGLFSSLLSVVVKSIFGGINAKFVVLLVVALGMWGGARGETISGTTYNTSSTSSLPIGWTGSGSGTSYIQLTSSSNYIQTDNFCQNGFTSIKIKARKYGGPSDAQALISASWYDATSGTETILGTITPTNTTLTDYTISTPVNPSANTNGYIKIQCKGASSSKGSGVSQVTITFSSCGSSSYNVTFNAGTGSCTSESLTESSAGAGVTLPTATPSSACAAAGWSFAGWATATCSETTTAPIFVGQACDTYHPTADCTLYAVYKQGEVGEMEKTYGWETNDDVTFWSFYNLVSSATITAHQGSNYGSNGSTTTASIQTKNIISHPISISCYYSKTTTNTNTSSLFKIQVSSNGSEWNDVASGRTMDNVTKETWYELSADLSSYTNMYIRVYYTGTNANRALDDVILRFEDAAYTYNSNPSCSAPTTATITYNANGGTGTTESQTDNIGATVQLRANGFTAPTGKYFAGWNTSANGSGTSYGAGSNYTLSSNITLYAQWTAYAVTAQSNDNNLGTVSCDGFTITATPGDCSQYATPAYTVMSGSATVLQNGDSFTVTPSSDCNIRINFESKPAYNVTWHVSGQADDVDIYCSGSSIVAPSNPASCDGEKVFVGWSTAPVEETDVAPTLYSKAQLDGTIVSANLNYYAVFADVEGSVESWTQVTSLSNITDGIYVIVNSGYYLPNTNTGSTTAPIARTLTNTVHDNTLEGIISSDMQWSFAGTSSAMTIRPNIESSTDYLYETEANNGLRVYTTNDTWAFETNGVGTFAMKGSNNRRYCAVYNNQDWRSYTTATHSNYMDGGKLYLYKKSGGASYSAFTTNCCSGDRYAVSFSPSSFETYTNFETSTLVASHEGNVAGTWELTCSPAATTASIASNGTITFEAATTGTYSLTAKFIPSGAGACPSAKSINVVVNDCHIDVPEPTYTATLTSVTLNWSPVADAEVYEIVWDDGEEPLLVTTNTATINTLPSCSTYSYTIRAIPAEGSGRCASEIYIGTATTTCPSKEFSLVTSTQDLVAGEDYIIASGYSGTVKVLSQQKANNRGTANVVVDDGNISLTGDEIASMSTEEKVYVLTLGGASGEWTLYDVVNDGYLYAASSSDNHLKTHAENDNNGKWTISLETGGAATFTAQGSNSRNKLRYNSDNTLFSCYSSGQNAVYLFREKGSIKTSVEVIPGLGYCDGEVNSISQTFTVSASRVDASSVKLTASADFEISLTENGTFAETLSLPLIDNELAETTIYVRLKTGLSVGNYIGSIAVGAYNGNTFVVNGPSIQLSGAVSESSITALSYLCATNETVTINVGSTCTTGQRYAIAIREGGVNPPHSLGSNETIAVGTSFGGSIPYSWVIYNAIGEVPGEVTASGVVPGTDYKIQAYRWNGSSWEGVKTCKITTPRITGLTYSDLADGYGSFSWSMTNALCRDDYNYVVTYSTEHVSADCASVNDGHSSGSLTHYSTAETLTSGTTYYARVFLLFDGEICSASDEISFTPSAITILKPGDLAVIGINNTVVDGNGDGGPDEISFVVFKDIANGTSIDFTDNGYERIYAGRWGTTEGIFRLTWNGGCALEMGSVITISETQGNIGSTTSTPAKPPVIGTNINVYTNGVLDNSHWSISMLSPGPLDLNDLDQIWFMQGGSWELDETLQTTKHHAYYTGNVLYGFTASGWIENPNYDKRTIDGIERGTKGSTMFPGQDCFTTNVMMNHGIAKYTGSLEPATKREWITRLNDKENWTSYVNVESGGVVVTLGRDLYNAAERNYRTYSGKFNVIDGETFTAGKWSGTKNGSWCNCANWLSLAVPNEDNDVIVPPVTTNELLLTADEENVAKCKILTILDGGNIANEDGASLWVVNDITIEAGGTFQPSDNSELNLYVGGNVVNNGTFKTNEYLSLTLTSENAQTIADVSEGDFVLNNLTFTADGHSFDADTIKLHGDFSASANGLENQHVSFAGTSLQKITNSTVISNLTMNNTGDGVVISSGNTLTITDEATFTDGALLGNVIFNSEAVVVGDLTYNSYVQGPVTKRASANAFTFPTGSNGMLGQVSVGGLSADATVSFGHNPDGFSSNEMPSWWNQNNMCEGDGENEKLDHVSNMLNWTVGTNANIEDVTFSAVSSSDVQFNEATEARDANAIKVAVYDDCWKNIGGSATVVDESSHHEITVSGVNIARTNRAGGQITFGSLVHQTLLPIELLSFSASCMGNGIVVSWSTASEHNNDYFVLERSVDAVNFSGIAQIRGAGNSIENLDYSYNDNSANNGENYYRLVQVDYDGTRTVSEIIVANCLFNDVAKRNVGVYPNPFGDEFTIVLEKFNGNADVEIFDMLGRIVYENKVNAKCVCELNVKFDFAPATYNLRITSGDVVINKQIVKQ